MSAVIERTTAVFAVDPRLAVAVELIDVTVATRKNPEFRIPGRTCAAEAVLGLRP